MSFRFWNVCIVYQLHVPVTKLNEIKCSQIQDCFVHFSNQRFKNLDIFIIHAQCIVSYIEKLYTNYHTLLRNLLMRMSFYLEDSSTYIKGEQVQPEERVFASSLHSPYSLIPLSPSCCFLL